MSSTLTTFSDGSNAPPLAKESVAKRKREESPECSEQAPVKKSQYLKKSSNAAATLADPIHEYRLSLVYISSSSTAWFDFSVGDQLLKSRHAKFSATGRKVFFFLVEHLRTYVESTVGIGGFSGTDTLYVWNWATWHRILIRLALSLDVDCSGSENDCWLTSLSMDAGGHPKYKVVPGRVEKRDDVRNNRLDGKWYFYRDENGQGVQTSIGRLACVLRKGIPGSMQQASHLCHNDPQGCFNPRHLVWESDRMNKSRNGCIHSCRFFCPHEIKCIYTNTKGRYLPHRNMEGLGTTCDSQGIDCYTERIEEL